MDEAILVVEDDDVNREFLERFLTDHGFHVTAVPSGEAALDALDRVRFQLVVLDLMLPGKNGGEVAWAAREKGLEAPIIAISGAMDQWAPADLEDLGVTAALEKPFSNDQLLDEVRSLMAVVA